MVLIKVKRFSLGEKHIHCGLLHQIGECTLNRIKGFYMNLIATMAKCNLPRFEVYNGFDETYYVGR